MSNPSDPIKFIDPETGEVYKVQARKPTVKAAEDLGFLPFSDEDWDRADEIRLGDEDV